MSDDLDAITSSALDAIARSDVPDPPTLTLLLRQYQAGVRDDVGEPLGLALASALEHHTGDVTTMGRAAWLMLFADAAAVSDDERLRGAAARLVSSLSGEWQAAAWMDEAAASVDACLQAADLDGAGTLISRAVDELERIVGLAYRPGGGVMHTLTTPGQEGGRFGDQVRTASALLSAYARTARVPYAMLAEELMQHARRFAGSDRPFDVDCEAARVLCRLAAVHRDDEYRRAAIVDDVADYQGDAEAILRRWSPTIGDRAGDAAIYGVALVEWRLLPHIGAS